MNSNYFHFWGPDDDDDEDGCEFPDGYGFPWNDDDL